MKNKISRAFSGPNAHRVINSSLFLWDACVYVHVTRGDKSHGQERIWIQLIWPHRLLCEWNLNLNHKDRVEFPDCPKMGHDGMLKSDGQLKFLRDLISNGLQWLQNVIYSCLSSTRSDWVLNITHNKKNEFTCFDLEPSLFRWRKPKLDQVLQFLT